VLTYLSDEMFVSILGGVTIFVIQFYLGKKGSNPPELHALNKHKNSKNIKWMCIWHWSGEREYPSGQLYTWAYSEL